MNMKRKIAYTRAALGRLAPLALVLGFLSCGNIFNTPELPAPAPAAEGSTVRVWLGDGEAGQRTLMPQEITLASFTKYRLFVSSGASYDLEPADFSGGYTLASHPGAGAWIVVDGYLSAEDRAAYKPAAQGSAELTSGDSANLNIILRPVMNASAGWGNGTFFYQINDPGSLVSYGSIYLYRYQGSGSYDYTSVLSSSSVFTFNTGLTEPVPPGQYLMQLYLSPSPGNSLWGSVNKMEIVHIYSNLETRAVYDISADDFGAATTISGSIDYSENGVPQSGYALYVYPGDGDPASTNSLDVTTVYDSSYSLSIPRPDEDITVRFYVYSNGVYRLVDSLAVPAGSAARTQNLSRDLSTVTLSGTVATTGGSTGQFEITAYSDLERTQSLGYYYIPNSASDNTWSIPLEAQTPAVPVYLRVYCYNEGVRRIIPGPVLAGSTNVPGIDLVVDPYQLSLYGKVNLTSSGQSPTNPRVEAYSDYARTMLIGSGAIDAQGNWVIQTGQGYISTYCYFTVFGTFDGLEYGYDPSSVSGIGVYSDDQYVDLGTVNIVPPLILSGTVSGLDGATGLVDDSSVENPWRVLVYAADTGSLLGSGEVQSDGSWQAIIPPHESAASLSFTLGTELYHSDYGTTGVRNFQSGLAGNGATSSPTGIALTMPGTSIPLSSTSFDIASPDYCRLFNVVPGAGNSYTFTSTGNVDTVMYLYSGTDGSLIDFNDDGGNLPNYGSLITATLSAGASYYVLVRTYGTDSRTGSFTLEVTSP
jgi:hypothetical protein